MTTISTHKLGPTETKGERIEARMAGAWIVRPYDYGSSDPHRDVARKLAELTIGEHVDVEPIPGEWTRTGYKFRTVNR